MNMFPLFVVLVLTFLPVPTSGENELVIDPVILKIQTGDSGTVTCTFSGNSSSIDWYSPTGSQISTNSSESNIYNENGALHLTNTVNVNQSGEYNCTVTYLVQLINDSDWSKAQVSGTVPVSIYVMPTYMTEGLIILGVNLALGAAFVGYSVKTMMEDRKRLAQYNKK